MVKVTIRKYKSSTLLKKYGFYFEYQSLLLMFGERRLLIYFIRKKNENNNR